VGKLLRYPKRTNIQTHLAMPFRELFYTRTSLFGSLQSNYWPKFASRSFDYRMFTYTVVPSGLIY